MNNLKAKLLLQRIFAALGRAAATCKQDVDSRFHFDETDYHEQAESRAYDELQSELNNYVIEDDAHSLAIGYREAETLALELNLRVLKLKDEGLPVVETAALTFLALQLGCEGPKLTSARVQVEFASNTLTYEGDIEAFKSDLRIGTSFPYDSTRNFRVLGAQMTELDVAPRESSGLLKTCLVSGKMTIEVQLASDSMDLDELLSDVCVSFGHPQLQSRQYQPKAVTVLERSES